MHSISNTWSFNGTKGPLGFIWWVFRTSLVLLVYLPASVAAIGVFLLLATNKAPMAQTVVTELVEFQAQGADSAPDLLHLNICDKFSQVSISPDETLCHSYTAKNYTIDEATANLENMVIRVYAALVFISLLCWLLFWAPARRSHFAYENAITKPAMPATEAERP